MLLLALVAPLAVLDLTANAASVSIMDSDPRFYSQRPCATDCFYFGAAVERSPDELAREIGCDVDPIENACFCREDLQNQADAYLSKCVNSRCAKKTLDIETARSIYSDYCTSNGYTRVQETEPPSGTQPVATVTVTVVHTSYISSGERRSSNFLFELAGRAVALLV